MLSERDIELAHPEAFDFVWGNLPVASRADFDRHLLGCRYCRAIVDEDGEIGRIIKLLPPHVEPSADLEDRTVAAMVAVIAEQRATRHRQSDEDRVATRVYQIPERPPSPEPQTQVHPRPVDQPAPAEPKEPPAATPLPVWRRYPRRLAAVAAVIAAAIVIPLTLGRDGVATAVAFSLAPPPGSVQAAASATVTARQDPSGSWALMVTVRHLKSFGDSPWYECWYVGTDAAGHRQVASAGTFIVPDSGSHTFSMTSAVDPREFKTMQIRLEEPGPNGAIQGQVVLTGTGKTI
jgi:hypothetical protein